MLDTMCKLIWPNDWLSTDACWWQTISHNCNLHAWSSQYQLPETATLIEFSQLPAK